MSYEMKAAVGLVAAVTAVWWVPAVVPYLIPLAVCIGVALVLAKKLNRA